MVAEVNELGEVKRRTGFRGRSVESGGVSPTSDVRSGETTPDR